MFRPVKTRKVYEEIVEQIKKLIVDGKLQPGDKLLSERELSETLTVSRASVREAFSALEMMGIIEIRHGEGSFVRQVSYASMLDSLSFLLQVEMDDVKHLQEVRKIMEVEMAGIAAVRAMPQDVEDMQRALHNMVEEVNSGEMEGVADADFHFAIARATHNPVLVRVMKTLSDVMTNTFHFPRQRLFLVENMAEVFYRSHYGIYESIVAKDSQAARSKMSDHLTFVEEAMMRLKRSGLVPITNIRESLPENDNNDSKI